MSFTPLQSLILSSCLLISFSTQAQIVNNGQYENGFSQQHYQAPKPLTEDSLKKRIDARINIA